MRAMSRGEAHPAAADERGRAVVRSLQPRGTPLNRELLADIEDLTALQEGRFMAGALLLQRMLRNGDAD
jgi:hypothetical protein